MGDDPVQVKFQCKQVDPGQNSRAVQISPHNSGTVIDSDACFMFHTRSAVQSALADLVYSCDERFLTFAQLCVHIAMVISDNRAACIICLI